MERWGQENQSPPGVESGEGCERQQVFLQVYQLQKEEENKVGSTAEYGG